MNRMMNLFKFKTDKEDPNKDLVENNSDNYLIKAISKKIN